MKLFRFLSALILAGTFIMPIVAQTDTTLDARKIIRDQRYINRQKRQWNRALRNGKVGKAERKNRNAQVAKVKRAEDAHDLGKDVQQQK